MQDRGRRVRFVHPLRQHERAAGIYLPHGNRRHRQDQSPSRLVGARRRPGDTRDFKNPVCIKALYCGVIRPVLEYACVVWKPSTQRLSEKMESIQRRLSRYATRLLPWPPGSQLPPYETRLLLLGLQPLHIRRRTAQRLFVAGLLQSNIDCPSLLQQLNFYAPAVQLRSRPLLALNRSRTGYGSRDPLNSMSVRERRSRSFKSSGTIDDF